MLSDQKQLIIDLSKLRNEPKGVSWANKFLIDKLIKGLQKKEKSQAELNELKKMYQELMKAYNNELVKKEEKQKKPNLINKMIQGKAKSTIQNLVKEKRLVFLSADKVSYKDKQGKTQELSFDEMATLIMDRSGMRNDAGAMVGSPSGFSVGTYAGITDDTIKEMLVEEYNKGAK